MKRIEDILRQVVLSPGEDGYWVAECPSLIGCVSQGATRQDAIANTREAIDWIHHRARRRWAVYTRRSIPESDGRCVIEFLR